jgi:laccase
MIIYGPASANYDVDLGTYPITDWYVKNVYQLGIASESGAPPRGDTALINGTMKVGSVGTYAKTNITATKKYRLRLINTSVDNMFQVSLDGHDFEVIAADFVPIKPFNTTWLFIGIGQRYDVVIRANQPPGNYWFRAQIPSGLCGSNTLSLAGNIKSIFSYSTATNSSEPTSNPKTPVPATCGDGGGLVPKLAKPVPGNQFIFKDNNGQNKLTLALTSRPSGNRPGFTVNSWRING